MLQSTPVLARIRRAVTNRVLTEAEDQGQGAGGLRQVLGEFRRGAEGRRLGGQRAPQGHCAAAALPLVGGGWADLAARLCRADEGGQEAIYILAGDNAEALAQSAQLEGFRARGVEVLLLTDPIDAFWPERMDEFDGKPIRSVTQGAADLAKLPPAEAPQGEAADVTALLAALKAALGDAVAEVRATDRLVDSAVVLAAGTAGPDLQMQRLLRRAGRAAFAAPPVLEINPRHKLVARAGGEGRGGRGCGGRGRAAAGPGAHPGWRSAARSGHIRAAGGGGAGGGQAKALTCRRRAARAPSVQRCRTNGSGASPSAGGNRRRINSMTSIPGTAQAIART